MAKVIISQDILGEYFFDVLGREVIEACREDGMNEEEINKELSTIKYKEDFIPVFNKYFKGKLIIQFSEKNERQ